MKRDGQDATLTADVPVALVHVCNRCSAYFVDDDKLECPVCGETRNISFVMRVFDGRDL